MSSDEINDQIVPRDFKGLRACLNCTLVKTFDQFFQDGCDNCPNLELSNNKDQVNQWTTMSFDGIVSLMKPMESWVAKWQGLREMTPGCYAIKVFGTRPDDERQVAEEYERDAPEDGGEESDDE